MDAHGRDGTRGRRSHRGHRRGGRDRGSRGGRRRSRNAVPAAPHSSNVPQETWSLPPSSAEASGKGGPVRFKLRIFLSGGNTRVAGPASAIVASASQWRDLPFNPIEGQRVYLPASEGASANEAASAVTGASERPPPPTAVPGREAAAEEPPAGRDFLCDPCQKSFHLRETFDAHMATHVYCDVPGCKFTCRDKDGWRLEMHKEMLHNRPDAPDLLDTSRYLSQRRQRFPTSEKIQAKIEELYFKASRGVPIGDESRRWMRMHSVSISKRPRQDGSYVDPGALQSHRAADADSVHSEPGLDDSSESGSRAHSSASSGVDGEYVDQTTPLAAGHEAEHADAGAMAVPPCEGNAALAPHSKGLRSVQGLKEQFDGKVPRLYVCPDCGAKGAHWASECPSLTRRASVREACAPVKESDEAIHPRSKGKEVADSVAPEQDLRATDGNPARKRGRSHPESLSLEDPPVPASARRMEKETDASPQVATRVVAPVAASRLSRGSRTARAHPANGQPTSASGTSLFEKLTQDERMNERGLLLQAIRFFVARNMFAT